MKLSRRALLACIFAVTLVGFSGVSESRLIHGGGSTAYEGLVASRARMLTNNNAPGNHQTQSRSPLIATENLTSIRVAFAGFYNGANTTSGQVADAGLGAATTITASIEYPAATFTQLKFSASSSGSIPDIGVLFSDYVTVSIPAGATFWVRALRTNTGGILFNGWQNSFLGEATEVAASGLTDKTMGGTIVDSGNGWSVPPLAVLAMTKNPSAIIIGDSLDAGSGDTEDSSASATGFNGKIGMFARSLGNVPFLNLGVAGETAQNFISHGTGRTQVIQKGSHLFSGFARNDIANGRTTGQITADLTNIYALKWSAQKVYQRTLAPKAADPGTPQPAWTTLTQQTPQTPTQDNAFNAAVLAGVSGSNGHYDLGGVVTSLVTPNDWTITPSPPYAFDLQHPNLAGYQLVAAANLIPALVYP